MSRTLTVRWGEAIAGSLTLDGHGAMSFRYADDWLADSDASPLSFSLPKQSQPFPERECRPFFDGLLPEGPQREAVASSLGVSSANPFALLEQLGGEVAGALTFFPQGVTPPPGDLAALARALPDREFASVLAEIRTRPFLAGNRQFRLSLAGVQSKLPVVMIGGRVALPTPGQPTTHILKPSIQRFEATTENEAFAMRLALRIGLDAAPAVPYVAVPHQPCLLVTRYDRRTDPDGIVQRLHQEDFCQALGRPISQKYAADGGPGFRECFDLVRRVCTTPAVDVLKLIDAAITHVILGNADAHAKNYSLLYRDGRLELAPLYDLLSTVAYPDISPRLAMPVARRGTLEELRRGDWNHFAQHVGVGAALVRRRVRELSALAIEQATPVAQELAGEGLSRDVVDRFVDLVTDRAGRLGQTI